MSSIPSNAVPLCNQLTLANSVQLAPATSLELVNGPLALARGFSGNLMLSAFPTTVQRSIPDLWTARVSKSSGLSSYNAEYTLVGNNFCTNCLSGISRSSEVIPVSLQPLPIQIQGNDNSQGKNCLKVSGGVTLTLDLKSIKRSGPFRGQLWVTLHQL